MAMQGARAGDLFRLQLARSLAPQGNPTTPLAALGNLGRLAASLYMQQNVMKGIEDRRTAADRAALAALQGTRQPIYAPRPTVGDVDLSPPSPGIPTAQIGERVGPDRAGLISILSNPNVSENISKLAGTLFAEQTSAEQAAATRAFQAEQSAATRASQAAQSAATRAFQMGESEKDRNLREKENKLNRQAQEALAAGKNDTAIRIAEEQNKVRRQIAENALKAKPHVEALDKNGNHVFVTQAEISADPTLTPVPGGGSVGQEVAAVMKKMRLFGEDSLTVDEKKIYSDHLETRRRTSDLERLFDILGQGGMGSNSDGQSAPGAQSGGWNATPLPEGQGSK